MSTDEIWKYKGTFYNVIIGPLLSEEDDEIYTTIYECDSDRNITDLHNYHRTKGSDVKSLLREIHSKKSPEIDKAKPEPEPEPEPKSNNEESSESEEDGCILC